MRGCPIQTGSPATGLRRWGAKPAVGLSGMTDLPLQTIATPGRNVILRRSRRICSSFDLEARTNLRTPQPALSLSKGPRLMWDRTDTSPPRWKRGALAPRKGTPHRMAFRPGLFDPPQFTAPNRIVILSYAKDLWFQRCRGAPFKPSVGLSGITIRICHPERSRAAAESKDLQFQRSRSSNKSENPTTCPELVEGSRVWGCRIGRTTVRPRWKRGASAPRKGT
jgi:hypothetical protein